MASYKDLYGLAATAAFLRGQTKNPSSVRGIMEGIGVGFSLASEDGDRVYFHFSKSEEFLKTKGFENNSYYASREVQVYNILNANYPQESDFHKSNLATAVHSVIFAYSINSNIEVEEINKIIGETLFNTAAFANNSNPFTKKNKTVSHPFTNDIIQSLIKYPYTETLKEISKSEKNSEAPLVNYNWYDVKKIMAGPNLQIMKDVENQYYYLSGKLIYNSSAGDYPDCISDIVDIQTETGVKKVTYIRNTPCVDKDSYIGPPKEAFFNRIFNDGPSSSGDFNSSVKSAYMDFDKSIIGNDWKSNSTYLYTFRTGEDGEYIKVFNGKVFEDANGRCDLNEEYLAVPGEARCVDYQRMHIGDNLPRLTNTFDDQGHCNSVTLSYLTGFRYVSLELDQKNFDYDTKYILGNPANSTDNLLKRSLNLNANPYIATQEDNVYLPYSQDQNGAKYWYIGPPQLNGSNALPSLAFFQTFNSPTFGDKMSICFYPTISNSNGTTSTNTSRTFQRSETPLFSGFYDGYIPFSSKNEKLTFNTGINSNQSDEIYQKFFGMGDAFQNQYDISSYDAENAGFFYTGYLIKKDGQDFDISSVLSDYSQYILGSPVKTFRYIDGYDTGIFTTKIAAQDSDQNKLFYYYVDNRMMEAYPNDKPSFAWNYFAEEPYVLVSKYNRRYKDQVVENYVPRYYKGPYSVETRNFLYPNAQTADKTYIGKWNGFPVRVEFDYELREETVREIYSVKYIVPDGRISNEETIPIIRPISIVDDPHEIPFMHKIFVPDSDRYTKNCNYNYWNKETGFFETRTIVGVEEGYAPFDYTKGTIPSGKYSNISSTLSNIKDLFHLGIRQTGQDSQIHKWFTGTGLSDYFEFQDSKPWHPELYHSYSPKIGSIKLNYIKPFFDISENRIDISDKILEAFPATELYAGLTTPVFNGGMAMIETGKDPLFLEFIGGRKGGPNALEQGGYHSKGFIGDSWMGMDYNTFGVSKFFCNMQNTFEVYYRNSEIDDKIIVFNSNPNKTKIWFHGLDSTPFKYSGEYSSKFDSNKTFNYNYNGENKVLSTTYSDGNYDFNISDFFKMKQGTGWYDISGLTVGPFDREVEIGMKSGYYIDAQSEFHLNGARLSAIQIQEWPNCISDRARMIGVDTGVYLGNLGRNPDYTILGIIPKGGYANFNIWSSGMPGYLPDPTGLGMNTGVRLTIRNHNYFWEEYGRDFNLPSGEIGWHQPYSTINNGTEISFDINHSGGFEKLNGTHELNLFSQTGVYYPVPGSDFVNMAQRDSYGNLIYPNDNDIFNYWRLKALRENKIIPISGWREGSRLSLKISNVKVFYDELPYERYKMIVPSGTCNVSGEFGYYAQADNCIFTEGFQLENVTQNDDSVSIYNPKFVSDILLGLPEFQLPDTEPTSPVLKAPSVMMQRRYPSGIEVGQSYVGLMTQPPYNYNKLLWPALSDLETYNPGETIEEIPPDDGNTFTSSTMIFSASQGQELPNGLKNPDINTTYGVKKQYQRYDSIATSSIVNSGTCITSKRGVKNKLMQKEMSGVLTSLGTTLSMVNAGLY